MTERAGPRAGRGFLALSALGALNAANAVRPLSQSGAGRMASFAAGVLTSELPLHAIGAHVLTGAMAVRRGALRTGTGRLGLLLTAGAVPPLARAYGAARRSPAVLEAALREALGDQYREEIADRLGPVPDAPLTVDQIALPRMGDRRHFRLARNLAYGDAGVRNRLDIWRRADVAPGEAMPVIVQVHGGGWVTGRKDDQALPLLTRLAQHGWLGVAVNYRLAPKATWPAEIVDVKRALAWVRSHIAEYGGDPSFVIVTGGSAGGHLAALAALSPNDPRFQPGFEAADTAVQAAVPMYGAFDLTNRSGAVPEDMLGWMERHVMKATRAEAPELWEAASPLCRVRADAPPFFVVHGTNDSLLPVAQARAFVDELRRVATAPVAYAELPLAQHGFDFLSSVRVHHVVRAVERFCLTVHQRGTVAPPRRG